MKFKKLESGRSMVEMLGVLAIIGVLSVGGIAGYSLAMRRHRANGILDTATKFALVVYNTCQQQMMNEKITDITGCASGYPEVLFANAGVGNLPSGVNDIVFNGIDSNQTTGVDTITLRANITDQKLCQAVASIVGDSCSGSWFNGILANDVYIKIKQN